MNIYNKLQEKEVVGGMNVAIRMFGLTLICCILVGCGTQTALTMGSLNSNDPLIEKQNEPVKKQDTPAVHRETITLMAAGDILMHNTEIWSGQQSDGSYKFDFFSSVERLIKAGDYASTNFEAPMAGPESGYTGYPVFNSPDAMADTLKNAGFNLVITANNHIMDRGVGGALRTLDVLKKAGLDTTGVYSSPEAQNILLLKEIRGVRVGYLAYTYGTNGIPVPKDRPYLVNLLDKEKVLKDIASSKSKVDILVLVLHWGEEYNTNATQEQRSLAREFMEAGADVILGSHPHVIEPMEALNIDGKNKFVIYSMGNFIGDQNGLERNSGIVLKLQFTKDFNSNQTTIDSVSYIPTFSYSYMKNGVKKFRVVPIVETIKNIQSGQEQYLKANDISTLEKALSQTRKQLGEGSDMSKKPSQAFDREGFIYKIKSFTSCYVGGAGSSPDNILAYHQ
ncbi:MAG: CapA family protein [Desulfitobacteriaceae bacterium]